jgi:hypothetical protein
MQLGHEHAQQHTATAIAASHIAAQYLENAARMQTTFQSLSNASSIDRTLPAYRTRSRQRLLYTAPALLQCAYHKRNPVGTVKHPDSA